MPIVNYKIEVVARGAKRDVYLLLNEGGYERRGIFRIIQNKNRYVLRHVKRYHLGALVDVIGLDTFQKIISVIYHKILYISRDETGLQGVYTGKYEFEAEISFMPFQIHNVSLYKTLLVL